jgi:ATP-dependent RNA helicase DeaD
VKTALATALEQRGYTTLTPVQESVTQPDLVGADLLVSAQTGSGKTLGFGLAIAPTLLGEDEGFGQAAAPLALVIAPTRELALQVKRELSWLYAQAGAVMASCVGGMDMRDERRALGRGAHVVVATPGRLRDHIMRNYIDLSAIRAVVLDEADEMLDLGFREDLEFILENTPSERQTLMFSATVPASIASLAKSYQRDAVRVSTTAERSQHTDIDYRAMTVSPRDAENAIINVLRFYESPNALVFANTRAMVNRLTTRLSNRGFSVVALSGELSQNERTHALQAMRDGRARVCVATDVAARGIDLPNLDLVVHAELPTNHEILLHRSGRTGRAGRKGTSVLIVPPVARKKAERILKSARLTATWNEAPSADAVRARDHDRLLADPAWAEPVPESDAETVDRLTGTFTATQLAAAFLRLYGVQHSAPEELSDSPDAPAERVPFGPSVWFSIPLGRADDAEPRRLLPMLCKAGNITRDDVGAIRVQQTESFVELKAAQAEAFVAALGPDLQVEPGVALTRLNGPPAAIRAQNPGAGGKPQARKPYADKPRERAEAPRREAPPPRPAPQDAPPPREGGKTAYKPRPKDDGPARPYNPDGPARKPREGGPQKPKPYAGKPQADRKPWQDKPDAGRKPWQDKPGGKPQRPDGPRKPRPTDDMQAAPKPVVRANAADPSQSMGRKKPGAAAAGAKPWDKAGKGGPRPPTGKPSSKKNVARDAGGKAGKGSGPVPPRRGKP